MINLVDVMSKTFEYDVDIKDIPDMIAGLKGAVINLSCQIIECCSFIKEYSGHGVYL